MKPCKTINIPTTDNTELECEDFVNSKCTLIIGLDPGVRTYFGLSETPTLNEVLETLATSLKDARERIVTLES